MVRLNPLEWSTATFLLIIVMCLGLRWWLMHSRRSHQVPAGEILLILPAGIAYFLVRGLMNPSFQQALDNAWKVVELELRLGIFHEARLQDFVLESRVLTVVANWIYIWAHWPFLAAVLAWLIIRRRSAYPVYRNAMLLSGVTGIMTFLLFPVAPPRLIDDLPFVDTVTEQSRSYRVLQPPALMNHYAAIPSLHVGWNFLMSIALVRLSSTRTIRIVGIAIPLLMWFATVATANHFIVDGLAGVLIAGAAFGVSSTIGRRGQEQRQIELEDFITSYRREGVGSGVSHAHKTDSGSGWRVEGDKAASVASRGGTTIHSLDLPRPFVIAHRHANDPRLLRAAEAAGADVIEGDLWLYRGRLELRHTKTLGPIPILWDRWSLESGWAPRYTLRELLEYAGDGHVLMLDLKGRNRDLPVRLARELRRTPRNGPVLVCSQNWPLLEPLREIPEVRVVHSIGNWRQLRAAWPRLERGEIDIVSIQYRLLSRDTVRVLKRHASIVCSWPINSDERLQKALAWGVDGINSDELAIVKRLFEVRPRECRTVGAGD